MASAGVSQNSDKTYSYTERTSTASVWLLSESCLTVWVGEGEWEEQGGVKREREGGYGGGEG